MSMTLAAMRKDFFPDREADMVSWSATFARLIASDYASLQLPLALVDDFVARQQAFAEAFAVASAPETRTVPSVSRKNDCRRAMESLARTLAGMIRANPAISDGQRAELGLSARTTRVRRLPTPETAPTVAVANVEGQSVSLRVSDSESPDRRSRPHAVSGVAIFTFTGVRPPADDALWHHAGNFSTTNPTILVPGTPPPFTPVWITARWYNPRGEAGNASVPILTHTQVGGPMLGTLKAA